MESGWNALLIVGPAVALPLIGALVASALAFWQYGWRGWKISLVFTLMSATAFATMFLLMKYFNPTT